MVPVIAGNRAVCVPTGFDWIDQQFNRLAREMMGESATVAAGAVAYPVDIHENDESLTVEAELPGFTKDEIAITIEKGVLQISAERNSDVKDENKGTPLVRERRWARYFRSFTLPTPVSEENVKATFENGVLHLVLPKRPEVKPRRIAVS